MKHTVAISAFLAVLLLVSAASAFTADSLCITLDEGGNAMVEFSYTLDWFERIFVYLRFADPAAELQRALEENSGLEIESVRMNERGAVFMVNGFARVSESNDGMRYRTPALSFPSASRVLARYWFAPFIQADFSPETTSVVFPDGVALQFRDVERIPPLEHTVAVQGS